MQGKKGVGGRMQDRTLYKTDGERERDQQREKTHWTTSLNKTGLFYPPAEHWPAFICFPLPKSGRIRVGGQLRES